MHMRYDIKTLRYYLNVPHVLPKWTFEKCCSFYKYFVVTIYLSKQLFSHFGIHLDFEGLWLDMECDHVNQFFFFWFCNIYLFAYHNLQIVGSKTCYMQNHFGTLYNFLQMGMLFLWESECQPYKINIRILISLMMLSQGPKDEEKFSS